MSSITVNVPAVAKQAEERAWLQSSIDARLHPGKPYAGSELLQLRNFYARLAALQLGLAPGRQRVDDSNIPAWVRVGFQQAQAYSAEVHAALEAMPADARPARPADPVAAAVAGSSPFEGSAPAGGLLADSGQLIVWLVVALAIGLLFRKAA